jgi:Eukaryotic aspartyl protease
MAANIYNIPMTNTVLESDYTGIISLGSPPTQATVILDSGSSTLGIGAHKYNPTADKDMVETDYVQVMSYGSGSWYGSVVQTTVTGGSGSAQFSIPNCNVGVAVKESQSMFGPVDGILGLAYIGLDDAFLMRGKTWPLKYDVGQIRKLGQQEDLPPFFNELTTALNVAQVFGFYSLRSIMRGSANPAQNPINQGWLILGGGPESTGLYTGAFQNAAVVGDDWYDTNLKSVQVGNQAPIPVAPFLEKQNGLTISNSIIDTGTNSIQIVKSVYDKMLASFQAINPEFITPIKNGALGSGNGVPNSVLDLPWPDITFVLQGQTSDVTLTVAPQTYWQADAIQAGTALFMIGATLPPQSILGLPVLNNYFTVFDQTPTPGIVRFASIVQPSNGQLPTPGAPA